LLLPDDGKQHAGTLDLIGAVLGAWVNVVVMRQ
jgi:hypothetical protein